MQLGSEAAAKAPRAPAQRSSRSRDGVKDGGLPRGAEDTRDLLAELAAAELPLAEERALAEGDVTCTVWVCGL